MKNKSKWLDRVKTTPPAASQDDENQRIQTSLRFRREPLKRARIRAAEEELPFQDIVERSIEFYCSFPASSDGKVKYRQRRPPVEARSAPPGLADNDRSRFTQCVMYLQEIFAINTQAAALRELSIASVKSILSTYAKGIELEALREDADSRPQEETIPEGDHEPRGEAVPRGA